MSRRIAEQANKSLTTMATKWHLLTPTLRRLKDHTDNGLKGTNYDTTNGNGGTGHSDPTVSTKLQPDDHARLLTLLRTLTTTCDAISDHISNSDPARPVNHCQDCGNALSNRIGILCSGCINTRATGPEQRTCTNCTEPIPEGKSLRNGRCPTCAQAWRRNGRERITTEMLALNT